MDLERFNRGFEMLSRFLSIVAATVMVAAACFGVNWLIKVLT